MQKDYDTHFLSQAEEKEREKAKYRIRRKREIHKKHSRMKTAGQGIYVSYYIKKEKPVYSREEKVVFPAYDEEEKSLYIEKNSVYLFTDRNGNDHYGDNYVWIPTGKIIHHPEKVRVIRHLERWEACSPYIQFRSRSNKNAKKFAAKRFRRKISDGKLARGAYRKEFLW